MPAKFSTGARAGSAGLWLICLLVLAMVLMPIAMILFSWGSDQSAVWQHLMDTQMPTLLRNTLLLVVGVAIGVTLLGVALAWLVVMCEFPGRRWFEWALMLPLAMPAYVLAFVVLGVFDFAGPVQQGLAQLWSGYRYLDVRSDITVILVLVLVLYPYVYMLSRAAFLAQSSDMLEAARVLGAGPWRSFFQVALPMARPAIVAGLSLALMETLADFGAVAVFNYDTFTTAIYKAWFSLFNLMAAAQLASLLLLWVGLALLTERLARGRRSFVQSGQPQHRYRMPLRPWPALLACLLATLTLGLAFVLPVLQLMSWAINAESALNLAFAKRVWHTLSLGMMAAALTVILALVVAFGRRQLGRWPSAALALTRLGYALPGSVLAVGIMLSFNLLDRWLVFPLQRALGMALEPWLLGSVLALLAAYWVRFLAVASGPLDAALERIKPSIPQAASLLGASRWRSLRQLYWPMLRPGLLTAAILVLIDVMKEMPATLLLRPYGWDTLAVRIFEMTSEGEWQRAALPALTLVLVGLVPVILAVKKSRHS